MGTIKCVTANKFPCISIHTMVLLAIYPYDYLIKKHCYLSWFGSGRFCNKLKPIYLGREAKQ
jgi:hypothetical protein